MDIPDTMPGIIEITAWHYAGFVAAVLIFLALDLGVFHREAHVVEFREALAWTALWFTLAMCFAGLIKAFRPRGDAPVSAAASGNACGC